MLNHKILQYILETSDRPLRQREIAKDLDLPIGEVHEAILLLIYKRYVSINWCFTITKDGKNYIDGVNSDKEPPTITWNKKMNPGFKPGPNYKGDDNHFGIGR